MATQLTNRAINESSPPGDELIEQGKLFYDEHLRQLLEPQHTGRFVAIDPQTQQYFLADKAIDALLAGRAALPDTLFFLARVGHKAAHKIGGYGSRIR
jgi:hypothetical protein